MEDGETRKWRGTLSSKLLPHGVLACRAAVLNLLADGVESGIRSWSAVGAITKTRAGGKPISVAYANVEVPALIDPITDESLKKRNVFDLLVKLRDPGLTIAELEALAREGRLGRGAITALLEHSKRSPTPSLTEFLDDFHSRRII